MVCLTGDIHHASLRTNEQLYLSDPRDSEVRIAVRFLRLIEEVGLKVTFYVTGKTLEEEWDDFRPIANSSLVELGGHTYGGLPRKPISLFKSWFTGMPASSHASSHGSYRSQRLDAERMIYVALHKTCRHIISWRSHGLVVDKNTYSILKSLGIQNISDDLDWKRIFPERTKEGLISHPINVIMDHDHIYHAHRTEDYVNRLKKKWSLKNDPTNESYTIEKWGDIVKQQVEEIEKKGGISTILMHPICMYTSDGFKTAQRLLEFFSQFKTIWAREVGEYLKE